MVEIKEKTFTLGVENGQSELEKEDKNKKFDPLIKAGWLTTKG